MKLGVIGGTALESISLEDRSLLEIETPWGEPSSAIICGNVGANTVYFINRHGLDHSIPPHGVNYQANIEALHQQGVDGIIALNAVGAINTSMVPGSMVVPHQLIDYTWGRRHSFSESGEHYLRHVDFSHPYCPQLCQQLEEAANSQRITLVNRAVHGVCQGPRLETAAEIIRMERDGCDLVGMTGMPEAALARELSIPYACLALVVNLAAGKGKTAITMADIAAVMAVSTNKLTAIINAFCQKY